MTIGRLAATLQSVPASVHASHRPPAAVRPPRRVDAPGVGGAADRRRGPDERRSDCAAGLRGSTVLAGLAGRRACRPDARGERPVGEGRSSQWAPSIQPTESPISRTVQATPPRGTWSCREGRSCPVDLGRRRRVLCASVGHLDGRAPRCRARLRCCGHAGRVGAAGMWRRLCVRHVVPPCRPNESPRACRPTPAPR
jgi:hypothetical protein